MKSLKLLLLMLFGAVIVFGQQVKKNFSVKGYTQDFLTHDSLSGVLILMKSKDKVIASTITDNNAHFSFPKIPAGQYTLTINNEGYKPFSQKLTIYGDSVKQLILSLFPLGKTLQGISVTAQRSAIEIHPDKIVYNVAQDITSQNGTATDVLTKVPQVTVDVNGNVEVLGNSSVQFLINGKPSTMFGNNAADALQAIPASHIQSVEVMSSPGSQYDASGTGGIINIILKKDHDDGVSGAIGLTIGTRQENGFVNIGYRHKNISLSAYFNGNAQTKVASHYELTRNAMDSVTNNTYFLHQSGNSDFSRNTYSSGISFDWAINHNNNLSASVALTHFDKRTTGLLDQTNTENDPYGIIVSNENNQLFTDNKISNSTIDLGMDYKIQFKKKKEQLVFSALYSRGYNTSSYAQTQETINDKITDGANSNNHGKDNMFSIAADYSLPISKNSLVEAGVKYISEQLNSDAVVNIYSDVNEKYYPDGSQSYTSTFNRSVYAGYVSLQTQMFNWLDARIGTRIEYTTNKAFYSNSGNIDIPDYQNFGPSILLSHTFHNKQILKLSYVYRIERPDFRDLNPFYNLADPHNITTGNPKVQPEIGNLFQLGYNFHFNTNNECVVTLLYYLDGPDIKSYTTFYPQFQIGDSVYDNVNIIRRDNIASEKKWGLNISGSLGDGKKLSIRPSIQLYIRSTKNIYATPSTVSGFEYRGTLNVNYHFSRTLIAELFGNYRSGIRWQGKQAGFYSYSVACRKTFWKGKANVGIVIINPFGRYLKQTTDKEATGFSEQTTLMIPYRSFGISFMYHFGGGKTNVKEDNNLLYTPPIDAP